MYTIPFVLYVYIYMYMYMLVYMYIHVYRYVCTVRHSRGLLASHGWSSSRMTPSLMTHQKTELGVRTCTLYMYMYMYIHTMYVYMYMKYSDQEDSQGNPAQQSATHPGQAALGGRD